MSINSLLSRLMLVALTSCTGASLGQDAKETETTPGTRIEQKNRAPVSSQMVRIKVPHAARARLKSGLKVLVFEDRRSPIVRVQLTIGGAGALSDPGNTPGLASITAAMLREGTGQHSSTQIAEDIERLGATIGTTAAFGSSDVTLYASGLSENFEQWFPIFVEMLVRPSFPTEELRSLTDRKKAELRQQRSSPVFLAQERFHNAVYGRHPASVIAPTIESLSDIRRDDVVRWWRERYVPQNAILAITGNLSAPNLLPLLKTSLEQWKNSGPSEVFPANPEPAKSRIVHLVDRPGSVQTNFAIGNIGVDRRSPNYIPMLVMNRILGGGPSARLFLKLREEKGYTYSVYSAFTAGKYRGNWRVVTDVRTPVAGDALADLLTEIHRLCTEAPSATELEAAKRALVASFAISLESPEEVLNYSVTREMYGLPDDYWKRYPDRVMSVTAHDVQTAAREYLDLQRLQIIAVGDGQKLRSVLERFGAVKMYNVEGQGATTTAAHDAGTSNR